jgi:hypothetical protein
LFEKNAHINENVAATLQKYAAQRDELLAYEEQYGKMYQLINKLHVDTCRQVSEMHTIEIRQDQVTKLAHAEAVDRLGAIKSIFEAIESRWVTYEHAKTTKTESCDIGGLLQGLHERTRDMKTATATIVEIFDKWDKARQPPAGTVTSKEFSDTYAVMRKASTSLAATINDNLTQILPAYASHYEDLLGYLSERRRLKPSMYVTDVKEQIDAIHNLHLKNIDSVDSLVDYVEHACAQQTQFTSQ